MTRPLDDVLRVAALLEQGVSQADAARRTGVPRGTLRVWIKQGMPEAVATHEALAARPKELAVCMTCPHRARLCEPAYAYLLGLYLGDGCISRHARTYRLRIVLDVRYPGIIAECAGAMALVLPNRVGEVVKMGCVEIGSYSQHWPCLFPQHGPGVKHRRPIVLAPWQEQIAIAEYPHLFLRGLIHSDGWRGTNRVYGRYEYPRYQFSNRSVDIQGIFKKTCDRAGIRWKQTGPWNVSISRRPDVEKMDLYVGHKS